MRNKIAIFPVLFLLLIATASAATIHGTVYDLYLDKQTDAIVTINTVPEQTFVSKDGAYYFEVPEGSYSLKAGYYRFGELLSYAEENITVTQEGDFIVDLILFPELGEEEEILNETDIEIDGTLEEESFWYKIFSWTLLIKIVLTLIAVIIVVVLARKILKKIRKEEREIEIEEAAVEKEEKKDQMQEIIEFIKSQNGRATQKEIRKRFFLSEASASLIITELEHKDVVERIKKGRGNVIILKEKFRID